MKSFLLWVLPCLLFNTVDAQTHQIPASMAHDKARLLPMAQLGTSHLQVVYEHEAIDTVIHKTERKKEILLEGKDASVYLNYGTHLFNLAVDSIGRENVTVGMFLELNNRYKSVDNCYFITKFHTDNQLLYCNFVSMGSYYYYEPIPDFNWEPVAGNDTVCGFVCQMAKCEFRGRTWIASYTDKVKADEVEQLSGGPWKFGGLQGVILKAVSEDGEHRYQALSVHHDRKKLQYPDRKGSGFKTTREKYQKAFRQAKLNPSQAMAGKVTAMDGSPVEIPRRFYNPEEKE